MLDAALALAAATAAQWVCARSAELPSEALCWILLAGTKFTRRSGQKYTALFEEPRSVTLKSGLPLAVGVVAACAYRSEERVLAFTPFLTPALVFAGHRPAEQKRLGSSLGRAAALAIATFSTAALLLGNEVHLLALLAGAVAAAALCGGFVAASAEDMDVEKVALPWAMCIVPLLFASMVVRFMVTNLPWPALSTVILAGVFKAAAWFFALRATRESPCIIGPVMTFAAAATINPFLQPSILNAVPAVVASFLALAQTAALIPGGRLWLCALLVLPVIPFASFFGMPLPRENHPVESLMRVAEARFDALVARQSGTYEAAELEYRRRYHIEPPAGFAKWYEYAVNRSSPIIDDYDMIFDVISPFLRVNGSTVTGFIDEAKGADGDADLWKCKYRAEFGITECEHEWRTYDGGMRDMMKGILAQMKDVLPDMEFLINSLDEPRVILQAEPLQIATLTRSPTWGELTASCDQSVVRKNDYGIPFVADIPAARDLCRHPDYEHMHGMLMSPVTFPALKGMLPVLSVASLSTMDDVLVPSSSYGTEDWAYHPDKDIPWDDKLDNVYWAGSMTGAWASWNDDSWKKYHRQRFVAFAEDLEPAAHAYVSDRNGVVRVSQRPYFDASLYNVTFTSVNQCEDETCKSEAAYFGKNPRADTDAPFHSKLVFDIDGNGSSGRYLKLLASRSAVLKQTLLREWHDERLVPWLHFIPVSLGLEELPELVEWLMRTGAGQQAARKMADRGRDWVQTALRKEDREVYLYRTMLELARAQDPSRGVLIE